MAYIWKTITFPATTPSTGQHYTPPIISVDDDGSLLLVQQLIANTSTAGPYSLTNFLVGFDAFGNIAPHGLLNQTTITSTPNAFANSTALTQYENNDNYRLTLPSGMEGGVGFFVSTDGSHWIIGRDVVTAVENSTTLTITPDLVDSTIPIADSILTMYAPSRGSGEYGVAYVLQNGSGDVNLMWQGYNADNTKANASPISLTGGFVAVDATPAAAVSAAGGAFVEAYENVNGTGNHYITFDSFDLDGTFNTNIGNGTGTFNLNATNNNVTDITDIRFAQFPGTGPAASVFSVVSSELRTDGFYHVVYRFKDGTTVVPAVLSSDTSAQHVQVSLDKTDGSTVVGWANESGNGAAHFAVFDSTGVQVGTDFSVGDSTMHFVSMSSLQDGRIEASFLKTIDAGTQTTSDVIYILDTRTPGQVLDYSAVSGAGQYTIAGTSGADTIIASDDFNYIAGAGDSDVFTFHALKLPVGFGDDEITDYNQGNSGHYNVAEGDKIDISGLTGGSSINGSVHIVDLGHEGTFLAVDPDGATGGYSYWGIAQLDNIHSGQTVNIITDSSNPTGITIGVDSNQGFAGNFNAGVDGRSDILLTKYDGTVAIWEMASNGFSIQAGANVGTLGSGWHVDGIGNFNAGTDSNSDILLRNDTGKVAIWEMNGTSILAGGNVGTLGSGWDLSGTGDFDGDGNTDILLNNDNGAVAIWKMNGFAIQAGSGNVATLGGGWGIAGTGDFDGDGKSDILLVNSSNSKVAIWEMNGTSIKLGGNVGTLGTGWHVVGTGDFNGDSKSDILLLNENGNIAEWQMNGTAIQAGGNVANLVAGWHVTGTGDYNADGHADVLLRSDSGQTAVWQMAANGFGIATGHNISALASDWATTAHHYDFV
jgi:hypothetical protein